MREPTRYGSRLVSVSVESRRITPSQQNRPLCFGGDFTLLLLEVTPEPKTLQQNYTAVSERLYARKLERGTLVAPFPMESASSLIDLTLPVAPSLSSRSHSRQHFMTPPAVTDTTHNEECGGSPSDGQLKRGGVGSPEHGPEAGQGGPSASSRGKGFVAFWCGRCCG